MRSYISLVQAYMPISIRTQSKQRNYEINVQREITYYGRPELSSDENLLLAFFS